MWFSVQQLLGGAAAVDPFTSVLQCAEEKAPVVLSQCGGLVSLRDQPLSLCDPVQEVRSCYLDASHPGVQALEHVCVCAWPVQVAATTS